MPDTTERKPTPSIPTVIRIGAVSYRVATDHDSWVRIEHATQSKGFYGHAQHTDAVIYLNPDAAPDVTRLTLWHEILYCLGEVTMGSPDWRHLPEDKGDAEEAVVRRWEHPTLAVLRDNPDLVAYLTA